MIKTLLVEDNKIMLQYLEGMLQEDGRFQVAGSLRDSEMATLFCRNNEVELILMDVQTLHGHSGLAAAEKVKRVFPKIKIVIITSLVDCEILAKARSGRADSLWYKDHGEDTLIDVISRTLAGEHIFPDVSPNVELGNGWSDSITPRQFQIIRMYIQGNSYKKIAEKLGITVSGVKYNIKDMIEKCGFSSKQELIAAIIDSKLITILTED